MALLLKRAISTASRIPKNLVSFLNETSKDVTSTVYRGTLFEYQTMESLMNAAGMELSHVGGKSDRGIDLRGKWLDNIEVIIQCKSQKIGCTPDQIRELMGTIVASSNKKKTIGILSTVSGRTFTRDVLSHFNASPIPLGLATVQDTTLKSLMFNKSAQRLLKNITITTQYDKDGNESLFIQLPKTS